MSHFINSVIKQSVSVLGWLESVTVCQEPLMENLNTHRDTVTFVSGLLTSIRTRGFFMSVLSFARRLTTTQFSPLGSSWAMKFRSTVTTLRQNKSRRSGRVRSHQDQRSSGRSGEQQKSLIIGLFVFFRRQGRRSLRLCSSRQ